MSDLATSAQTKQQGKASTPLQENAEKSLFPLENQQQFEQVVADYYTDLYRFGLSLAKNTADANDLVQETFLRFARKGGQIKDFSKVKSWLFTTLYRQHLACYRRKIRFPQINLEEIGSAHLGASPSKVIEELEGHFVLEALQQLEEKFRAPLALFFVEDMSYKEIAKILRLPMGTVMSRIHRAKQMLREKLQIETER